MTRKRRPARKPVLNRAPKLSERFELLSDALLEFGNLAGQPARKIGLLKMSREQPTAHLRRDYGDLARTSFHLRLEIR